MKGYTRDELARRQADQAAFHALCEPMPIFWDDRGLAYFLACDNEKRATFKGEVSRLKLVRKLRKGQSGRKPARPMAWVQIDWVGAE